jgi:hypothetical protein
MGPGLAEREPRRGDPPNPALLIPPPRRPLTGLPLPFDRHDRSPLRAAAAASSRRYSLYLRPRPLAIDRRSRISRPRIYRHLGGSGCCRRRTAPSRTLGSTRLRGSHPGRNRKFADSPLEGSGFETSDPDVGRSLRRNLNSFREIDKARRLGAVAILARYRKFESGPLQLRVRKPSVPQRRSGEYRRRPKEVRNLH